MNSTYAVKRNYGLLILFVVGVVVIGSMIGYLTRPDAWFESLNKPFFQPPPSVFGPVWTILYILIGVAGWRVWTDPALTDLRPLWIAQMVLNWMWSPAFFAIKSPALALIVIIPMWICILAFVRKAWPRDRMTAVLFLPYLAWVTFATALNAAIWILN